jgi:hypothetical protein
MIEFGMCDGDTGLITSPAKTTAISTVSTSSKKIKIIAAPLPDFVWPIAIPLFF